MRVSRAEMGSVTIAIGVSQLPGVLMALIAFPQLQGWFSSLQQPEFMPPLWFMNPLWIGLYALTGISLYLIYKQGLHQKAVQITLGLFSLQFLLNLARPVLMFSWHNLGLTVVSLGLLWVTILLTMVMAFRISRTAMWLLVPVLIWTTFGGIVAYAFWQLN